MSEPIKPAKASIFSPVLWQACWRLGTVLLLALAVGAAVGRVALVMALALGAYLAVQIWNLLRVDRWLRNRRTEAPPDMSGPWGELVALVSRIYRRKVYHRSRGRTLLREFQQLTTAMPEGAVLLGPGNEILWFNSRAKEWLGLRRKRDFGMRIENLVRHPDFIEYLRRGEAGEGVVVYASGDGGRWLSFHLVRAGSSERQLLIVRDISREQQIESMRKDFVANASHELRSPLTVITGYLDALADDAKLDPAWKAPVQEMRRQADRMGAIINDLLELSKLESSERMQDEQLLDIGGMLALIRRDVMAQESRPGQVTLRIESDAFLRGSETEMHSILSNLVSNAVKYTPPEGQVELRWWVDADGAHVSVKDTGVGIAAENIPRLTERFYRVDAGRARDLGGSGLGLAIVKHAVQRHDGKLSIESREGVGSTFTCHFPLSRVVPRERDVATG